MHNLEMNTNLGQSLDDNECDQLIEMLDRFKDNDAMNLEMTERNNKKH